MSDFGDELGRLCRARGVSLHALARQSHYDVGYLSKVANGHKRGSRDLAAALDTHLSAEGALLAAWENSASPATRMTSPTAWPRLPRQSPSRRLAGQPVSAGAAMALPGLQLVPATATSQAGGGSDLAAMHGFRCADRQVGGGHLYATVLCYLHTAVAPRLFSPDGGGAEGNSLTAAGALTEMAGWMAHDAGCDEAAGQHFHRSFGLATAGGDHQLTAHVLGSMSHLALHRDEPARAISLARQGQEVLAQAPPNPGLGARLLALEARGLAALPQPEPAACARVLLRAEQALDQDHTEPSPWTSRFDEGSLASEAARSLRQLGQYEAAARHAQRIIELRPGSHARSRAFGQLLLASVLVAQGEPEAACAAARQALDATQTLSSYLVVQQVRELANLLQPYHACSAVADFLTAARAALSERLWLYSWLGANEGNSTYTASAEPAP
ncbi:MAG TPA: helix-turn-helix transcriptional regulator [Streptosporangiaceae bacterium]|nr:helix-turn-helix transcriptional regulator [Streptosporangiaceae bacterium]